MKLVSPELASVVRRLASRFVPVLAVAIIASLTTPNLQAQTGPLPRAMWVWQADNITDTTKRTNLINFCVNTGISTLFISTGRAFIDPADPVYGSRHPVSNPQLGSFNIAAHAAGIAVWAVDGDPAHCLDSNHEKVLGRLDKARVFNYNQSANARLDGFQWDIEPHGLAAWSGANNSTRRNYLSGMLKIAEKVNIAAHAAQSGRLNLNVGFVITFWYDNSEYVLSFNGTSKATSSHMFDVMKTHNNNHVAVMAYRDTAGASFPLAYNELEYAKTSASNVKVWYGQETGPFTPTYITFHEEGSTGLNNAIGLLETSYLPPYRQTSANVVAGIAIHAYNYYGAW